MGSCTTKITEIRSVVVRIALVGDAVSGKTAILTRFTNNEYPMNYKHNSKNFVAIKSYLLNESTTPVTVEVWEIHNNPSLYVDMALVVADISMPISQLQDYYWKWYQVCKDYGWGSVSVVLSKKDLKVVVEEGYTEKIHDLLALMPEQKVFITSALLNEGIDLLFKSILSTSRALTTY